MNSTEWADRLEKIASAINETVYSHDLEMSKYARERKVRYDDADLLKEFAAELRSTEKAKTDAAGARTPLPDIEPSAIAAMERFMEAQESIRAAKATFTVDWAAGWICIDFVTTPDGVQRKLDPPVVVARLVGE